MEWQETGWVLLAACTALLLPGLAVCAAAGARSILLLGLAGPVSVSIIGLGAVVLGLMDRPLTPAAVVVATVAAAVPILVLRLATAGPSTVFAAARPTPATAAKALAAAVAVGVLGSRLLEVFQRPDSISQTLDNIFHLNLARFVLDTGSGSSLAAGQLTDPGAEFKPYPAAWHDVVALVAGSSGASVPVAATSVNLVIGAVLWPLAVMLLGTVLAGDRPVVWLLSGLLAGAFPAFPYLMVDFGVLYPNYLSLALLPALLALSVSGTRKGAAGIRRSWFLFLLALPGLGLAHPSSLVALAALSLPMGVRAVSAIAGSRRFTRRSAAAAMAAAVGAAYGAVVYTMWTFLRPQIEGIRWEARMDPAQAFGEGILNAPLGAPVPVLVAVLTALGVGTALRSRRDGWVIGVLGVGVGLYTVANGFPWSDLRTALVGSWYNDPPRLAAILPAAALGAVILGATAAVDRAAALARAAVRAMRRGGGPRRLPAAEAMQPEQPERQAAPPRGAAAPADGTPVGRGTPDLETAAGSAAGHGPSFRTTAPAPAPPVPRLSPRSREAAAEGGPTSGTVTTATEPADTSTPAPRRTAPAATQRPLRAAAEGPDARASAEGPETGTPGGGRTAPHAADPSALPASAPRQTTAQLPFDRGAASAPREPGRSSEPADTRSAGQAPPGPGSRPGTRPRPGSGAAALVGLLCAAALGWAAGESAAVDHAVRSAAHSYDTEEDSRLLDRDEQALLSRLGQLVPEDAVVVGNPWTGTALVYALADRAALTPHVFWTDTADSALILNHLDEAVAGGEVCAAIERTGAYYALDFGTAGVHGEAPDPPGLDNLADNPAVQLIDQAGEARLYRVTACGEGS